MSDIVRRIEIDPEEYEGLRAVCEAARLAVGLREGCKYDSLVEGIARMKAMRNEAMAENDALRANVPLRLGTRRRKGFPW